MTEVVLRARVEAEVAAAKAGIQSLEAEIGKLTTAAGAASTAGKGLGSALMIPTPVALATIAPTLDTIRAGLDAQSRSATALAAAQTHLGGAVGAVGVDMTRLAGIQTTVTEATRDEIAAAAALAAEIEQLRQRVAPAITAQEMLATAQKQVADAVKAGILTQQEANLIADQARAKLTPMIAEQEKVAKSAFAAAGGTRMLGQQLSQVVQQGAATGNWLQALAIQLPDIALGFGNIAIVASIVATVALPMIVQAFGAGKTAAETAADANKAYAESFSALEKDLSEVTSLHAAYVAAVQSGNAAVIAGIQSEARARAALMRLDEIDALEKQKAAKAANDEMQAEADRAFAAVQARLAQLTALRDAQARQQAQLASHSLDVDPTDYLSMIETVQGALRDETKQLEEQQRALQRNSAEYDVIQAKLDVLHAKQQANADIMREIADGTLPIISGLDGAAASAGGLETALDRALGVAQSLEATIANMNFSNIGKQVQLAALEAGKTPDMARLDGQIAEKRAQLAPALTSRENDVREQAAGDLRRYAAAGQVEADTSASIAAREAQWRKDHPLPGSGGAGGKPKQGTPADLSADAKKTLAELDAQVSAIQEKVKAGLMSTAEGSKAIDDARLKANDDLGLIIAKLEQLGPAGQKAAAELKTHLLSAVDIMGQSVKDFSKTMADGLRSPIEEFIKGTESGKEAIASFGDFVVATLAKMAADKAVTGFFEPLMNSIFSAIGIPGFAVAAVPTVTAHAKGGVPDAAPLSAHRNQVLSKPTLFPMRDGIGLMAEAGDEAIMPVGDGGVLAMMAGRETRLPLIRGRDGRLGVQVPDLGPNGMDLAPIAFAKGNVFGKSRVSDPVYDGGSGGGTAAAMPKIAVNITPPAGHTGTVKERVDHTGFNLDVMFEAIESRLAGNIRSGRGPLNTAVTASYGLPRATR